MFTSARANASESRRAEGVKGPRRTTGCPLLLPEAIPAERWIAAGVFAVACLYLFGFRRYTTMDPDEGIILQGAERVLRGEILYRDFFSFLTPGSYYWLALLFRVFGNSFTVARTTLAIYGGFFSVFAYWMARRVCARWIALMTAHFVIVSCLPWRFAVLHNWDSSLWLCAAIYCAVLFVQRPSAWWAFGAGTNVCLTFLFEQSKGAGLVVGLLLGFLILAWMQAGVRWLNRRNGLAFLAGLAWPLLLTFVYFVHHHALGLALTDWIWPLHHYSAVNRVPYGTSDWSDQVRRSLFGSGDPFQTFFALLAVTPCFVLPALPLIAALALVYWIFAARRGALVPDRAAYYVIVASTTTGLLLALVSVRPNVSHFVYFAPLLYLVLAWFVDGSDFPGGVVRAIGPVLAAIVFVAFSAVGMAFLIANRDAKSVTDTRRGAVRTPESDGVLSYMQAHLPSNAKIFVYPYFPLAYYLTATFSATRYDYLQPGMHTRDQNEEAIQEIQTNRTPVVLFEPSFYEKIPASWPNTPVSALARDPVADYIVRNYHSCVNLMSGSLSHFSFMVRNGTPCPTDPTRAWFGN